MARTILMECLLHRTGGTRVLLGGKEYHFKDDGTGRHVCRIGDSEHVSMLAAIREGYRMVLDEGEASNGKGIRTPEAESVSTESQAEASPDEGADTSTNEEASPPDNDAPLADLDDEALREVYAREVGRRAHPNAKRETMIATVETVRAENGQ